MADLTTIGEEPRSVPPELRASWTRVATHTHMLRAGAVSADAACDNLVAWCLRHGVQAVGVGSPWEPVSTASYRHWETAGRDQYEAGLVSPESVMDRAAIDEHFAALRRNASGRVLFYMDNETPKARHGHMWWFGFNYTVPAWNDYSQDRPVTYFDGDPEREINPLTGRPHRRRSYLEVVAEQRRCGGLGVWAHPTSWWRDGAGAFVTNIAAECVQHLWIDGFLDGLTVMGYDACHRDYQALWFHLLDTGAVIPGFAETDTCFDRADLDNDECVMANAFHLAEAPTGEGIRDAARTGRCCMSTGAFLDVSVDGIPMGSICRTRFGVAHELRIEAYPHPQQDAFSRLDVIGPGGQVLASREHFRGGVLRYGLDGRDSPGYVVVRGFGEHDDPGAARQQDIRHCALSNPVYMHPDGFQLTAAITAFELEIAENSPWLGGQVVFEDAAGEPLEQSVLRRPGVICADLPAGARVRLRNGSLPERMFYIAEENPGLQAHARYLYAGEFLLEHAGLEPGQVPTVAFRRDAVRNALRQMRKTV